MKTIPFTKMVAAGNDFLVIDHLAPAQPRRNNHLAQLALRMCCRQTGVGADGLLILESSKKTDYKMRILNADGSEAEMCGNGARCLAAYVVDRHHESKKIFGLETLAGTVWAKARGERARVRLTDPRNYQPEISLKVNGRTLHASTIDTGVPHAVIFVDSLTQIDVETIGRTIRFHNRFKPRGTNVDFVEQHGKNFVELRTYERGVEAETLGCGTGTVAAGLIGFCKANPHVQNQKNAAMKVKTKSGEVLDVTFDIHKGILSNVWLKGIARFVAGGEYYPPSLQNFRLGASADSAQQGKNRSRRLHV